MSQTYTHGGGYLNHIKMSYSAGIELVLLCGNSADLVKHAFRKKNRPSKFKFNEASSIPADYPILI